MPQTIGALIIYAVNAIFGSSIVGTATVAGVSYETIIGATVLGATSIALASSLQPSLPKPDGQLSLQQPTPFRRRVYGRAKMGGYLTFWTSLNGTLFSLVVVAAHEIDAYESFWLGDREVNVTSTGWVNEVIAPPGAASNQFSPDGEAHVQLYFRTGAPGQTASPTLMLYFPTLWTEQMVGVGMADILLYEGGVSQQQFPSVYPGGQQPVRAVLRGAKIYDPRDETQSPTDPTTWKWTDNAALVILDYLTNSDGWRIAQSIFLGGNAAAITLDAINTCDELIELVSGGTEPRYRLWGFYDFNEEPRSVLARMQAACGGWLEPQTDGSVGIRVGKWIEPTFTITDDMIVGYEVQHFVGEFDAINEIRATFNDPNNDYQDTETSPLDNDADIAARGYIKSSTVDARHCPSFTQVRRIQKIALAEASPDLSITLFCNYGALGGRNKKFLNAQISSLNISRSFRVTAFIANTETGSCTVSLASFASDTYDWDPNAEEGPPPPVPPDISVIGALEEPQGLQITVVSRTVGATVGPAMQMICDPSIFRTDLYVLFEYQLNGAAGWTQAAYGDQQFSAETPILGEGVYNVRVCFEAPNGVQSVFEEVDGITVSPSAEAPMPPTNLVVVAGSPAESVLATATAPNSPSFAYIKFWRSPDFNFSDAIEVSGPVYGSPNAKLSFTDLPGTGTWYYFAVGYSITNSASPPSGFSAIFVP
jgi:hypothetical protein